MQRAPSFGVNDGARDEEKGLCVGCIRAFLWDWPSAANGWALHFPSNSTAFPFKWNSTLNGAARHFQRRGTPHSRLSAVRSERAWMPFLFFRSSAERKREFFFSFSELR
jgi:hypothetical protein